MCIKNLSVAAAAKLMGVSAQYIRIGIQKGVLPFGTALMVGGQKYTYYISPEKFMGYTGLTAEEIEAVERELSEEACDGRV